MTPPRLAIWLAGARVPRDDREFVLGDLEEEFVERATRDGAGRARRWYWRQAIRSFVARRRRRYQQRESQPGSSAMPLVFQDVRFGLRLLRRSPAFTGVVVLTLALGLGATTAIFSVVHAALLKPLPFKDPDRLVITGGANAAGEMFPVSYPQLRQWRESFGAFEELAGYFGWNPTLAGEPESEILTGIRATATLFSLLGVDPIRGRLFTPAEEARSAAPVVLISDALWRRRFNADEDIVGRRITLNDATFTVIGVLPAWFRRVEPDEEPRDLVAPLRVSEQTAPASLNFIRAVARLKPGESAAVAKEVFQAEVLRANPDAQPPQLVGIVPMRTALVGNSRSVLLALFGAVGFLLLITAANLANLMLTRAVSRRREMAVRLAVGAGRGRIVTQLVTECLVLSVTGGLAGVVLAWVTIRAVASLPALATAGIYDLSINWTVLAFGASVSIATGLLFGLTPAIRAGHASVTGDLRDGGRVAGGRDRLRSSFVVAQVALTLMLLVGAGLLARSLANLIAVDKGFDGESAIAFNLSATQARYPTNEARVQFFEAAMERVSRIGGVEAVGLANDLPMGGGDTTGTVPIDGRTFEPGQLPQAQKRIVSPGYFSALRIPVLRGRGFAPTDDANAPPVIVISRSFARRWFPDEDPLGKRIGFNWDIEGFQTIVGVVADVKHNGLDDPDSPAIYINHAQRPDGSFTVVVRTAVAPESLMPAIRSEIKALDPTRPVSRVQTMTSLISQSMAARRLSLDLVGSFALIGLLLAATGIYGVVNHATQQRSREFGIRLALGAETSSVRTRVLRQGLQLALAGVAIGLGGSLALSGVIRAQLFGIGPSDPLTIGAVAGGLILVALVACSLPARRATRINPADVLKAE